MKDKLLKLYIKAQILREDHGQDLVEYALVVGILALGCVTMMNTVAGDILTLWTTLQSKLKIYAT